MEEENNLLRNFLNYDVDSRDEASRWIEHLTLDERNIIENPSELEHYRNNIYRCVRGFAERYKVSN